MASASGDLYGAAVFVDRGAALAVRHSVIRDSGTIGLWLQNAEAEFIFDDSARLLGFAENRFESNAAAPLRLSFSQVPMLDAATAYGPAEAANGANEIEVRWGGLRDDATVRALSVPYHFVGDGTPRLFFTGNPAHVTFAAGVTVIVDAMVAIDFNGKVDLIGTSAAPIVFRGVTATAGVWYRITVGDMGGQSPVKPLAEEKMPCSAHRWRRPLEQTARRRRSALR